MSETLVVYMHRNRDGAEARCLLLPRGRKPVLRILEEGVHVPDELVQVRRPGRLGEQLVELA